ncbi:MAG: hypothetical protein FWE90_12630 [Defluviitaleaceae bacterium]|nr:hypothetical protein [Defluviitaleaceae bacterium]MCL2604019.1 hypothetical protein [Defluviitaleaceae bacterium]
MNKRQKEALWNQDMDTKLQSCCTVQEFDNVFDTFGFPKDEGKRLKRLINATGHGIGDVMIASYSPSKNELAAYYEVFKHSILLYGGKLF